MKIGLKVIIASIVLFFISCWGNCPDVLPYFEIIGIQSTNMKFENEEKDPFYSSVVSIDDSVFWNKFFINIYFSSKYIAQSIPNKAGNLYALSCEENGYSGSKQGIDTLFLIAQNNYNARYLKNDTLNEIAQIHYWPQLEHYGNLFVPISNYISENSSNIYGEYFSLILIEEPEGATDEYWFKLVYVLNNGESFEVETEKVHLY